ncbi:cation diffusion facilitator family transporter [Pseudoroseicyclus sp. H15]
MAGDDHGHDHAHGRSHGGGHDHGHSHAGHAHGGARALGLAAGLTGVFMVAEIVGGLVSGSLALLADAGHMATDLASLLLAFFAVRMARRPADARRSYGFDRVSVLAAFVNGLALFAIAIWISFEAIGRFLDPAPVLGGLMLWVAIAGLLVNILAFRILHGAEGGLNTRAAALHVMGDLLGSVGAIAAALIILWTGWTPIDPILSVVVSLLILRSAWRVLGEAGHILLEGTPRGFDPAAARARLAEAVPGVTSVDHLHAWCISEERLMATLEADLAAGAEADAARAAIKRVMEEEFGIGHVTVEMRQGA